jgi:predicted DsbA family dithiol-disulfide isomerase
MMQVDVIADVTCPWCFIGLKRFMQSLALRPEYPVDLVWRPFLLNPELREGTIDRMRYLERVFGSKTRIKQFYEAIGEAGKTVGIAFDIEYAELTPSSINAHSLILFAGRYGLAIEMAEAVYMAHFVDALDIGDRNVLVGLAEQLSLDTEQVLSVLENEIRHDVIIDENARIHRLGINGVPSFIFAGKNIISGAQEPETLLHMIDLMATLNRNINETE